MTRELPRLLPVDGDLPEMSAGVVGGQRSADGDGAEVDHFCQSLFFEFQKSIPYVYGSYGFPLYPFLPMHFNAAFSMEFSSSSGTIDSFYLFQFACKKVE